MLKYCNECYRDNYDNENYPFLNPSKANEILIKEMNKTIFFLGTFDPLRDDIVRLVYKISKFNILISNVMNLKDIEMGFMVWIRRF